MAKPSESLLSGWFSLLFSFFIWPIVTEVRSLSHKRAATRVGV